MLARRASANRVFLAFFPFNGINNLRVFNVAFSSIPTAPTKLPETKTFPLLAQQINAESQLA
jgi:hypothetical protein